MLTAAPVAAIHVLARRHRVVGSARLIQKQYEYRCNVHIYVDYIS
jgi:hypothetical protein